MGVEIDSSVYKRTFYGILNAGGQFWTPIAFDSERSAKAHINAFFVDRYQLEQALQNFKIVPVRSHLTALDPS
jgi:hypothetical protein